MTDLADVASFAVVAGLLTIIPGLDTALVIRTTVTQGRGRAFAVALGINTGVSAPSTSPADCSIATGRA